MFRSFFFSILLWKIYLKIKIKIIAKKAYRINKKAQFRINPMLKNWSFKKIILDTINADMPFGKKYISPLNISKIENAIPKISQKTGWIKKRVNNSKFLFTL